jgi:hypothetical protein
MRFVAGIARALDEARVVLRADLGPPTPNGPSGETTVAEADFKHRLRSAYIHTSPRQFRGKICGLVRRTVAEPFRIP